jgi:hypothetical protein
MDKTIEFGNKLNQESTNSLENSLDVLHETIQVGNNTSQKLQNQKDTLIEINNNLENIDTHVDQSKIIIRKISSNLIVNSCLLLFSCALVITIIITVIIKT